MRRAIIDNATLTAVQRLMGKIQVVNKYSLDGDILALETLIQTLLFYDEVYYIDDYKEKFKTEREKYFYYLNKISFNKEDYEKILKKTDLLSKKTIPVIKKGEFQDENFAPFFELLKMNNIFTWDMSSSEYYLTEKMLSGVGNEITVKEYSKISQMIFSEGVYENLKNEPKSIIIGADGNRISSNDTFIIDKDGNQREAHIGNQTKYYLANLSWLAYRTIYYSVISSNLGGSLVLHPIRDSFQINYLYRSNPEFINCYTRLVKLMNGDAEQAVKKIVNVSQPLINKYDLPLFSVSIIEQVYEPSMIIERVLHMREEGPFVDARRELEEIEKLFENEKNSKGVMKANKLLLKVQQIMKNICEQYYVSTPQGLSLSPMIEILNAVNAFSGNVITPLPNFSPQIKHLNGIKNLMPQKGVGAVYKSVVNELASIAKIGKYYDKLTSDVRYSDSAGYYTKHTEEEKYRFCKSYWKIPME